MTIRRLLTLTLLVAALAAGGGVVAPRAEAASPCWKVLLNDWLDGRIDKAYKASCYRQAIKHLPEDVDAYSDAREDINRALLVALRNQKDKKLQDRDVIAPEPAPADGDPIGADGEAGSDGEVEGEGEDEVDGGVAGTTTDGDVAAAPGGDDGEGGDGVLGAFEPSNADSVPVPLLVLAGLAALLLAAAAAGFVARRLQARRARIHPGPPSE